MPPACRPSPRLFRAGRRGYLQRSKPRKRYRRFFPRGAGRRCVSFSTVSNRQRFLPRGAGPTSRSLVMVSSFLPLSARGGARCAQWRAPTGYGCEPAGPAGSGHARAKGKAPRLRGGGIEDRARQRRSRCFLNAAPRVFETRRPFAVLWAFRAQPARSCSGRLSRCLPIARGGAQSPAPAGSADLRRSVRNLPRRVCTGGR